MTGRKRMRAGKRGEKLSHKRIPSFLCKSWSKKYAFSCGGSRDLAVEHEKGN